jgi:transglutaminase-like putative cysteine protease
MKYRVTHRTHYRYQAPVTESFNEARLQPVSNERQHCHSFVLRVFPATRVSHHLDSYSNHVHFFEVPEAHDELLVEGLSIVEIFPQAELSPPAPVAFSQLEPYRHQEMCYDFLHTSQYVSTEPFVRDTARAVCGGAADVWSTAVQIMGFIYENFTYAPQTTSVNTHMEEVLRLRKGVCQDFAHVMIGLCRSLGIPARYVSGYIFNGDASSAMRGAQASHAWCEILMPGWGWHGLDPTNNLIASVGHIKVAVGRDYADVAPLRGTYKGTNQKEMDVAVAVSATI